jgi:hypothetical protein
MVNQVIKHRGTDWSKVSQDYWEQELRKIRAMMKQLDQEKSELKSKLKVIHGNVPN